MTTQSAKPDYFTKRGLRPTSPESLNAALREVLEAMPTTLYGEPEHELTPEEQAVLEAGGVDLKIKLERDPIAETAVQFAAIIDSSMTTKEAARRLGIPESQVRQMIARRTLYSVLLNSRRHIPLFQFQKDGSLVANITKVNAALSPDLHPVEVYEWYTQPGSRSLRRGRFGRDHESATVAAKRRRGQESREAR